MGASCLVSGGFCFWCKKKCASALKQYTQVELKTGFVNKFVDFCQKNRLRGGKRFYLVDSSEVRSLEVGTQQGFFQQQQDFQRIQQRQGMLKRSIEAAFLFRFWLQSWLHNLQFALNTAFASVKQVSIIQSVYGGSGWKSDRDAVCGRCLSVVSDVSALGVSLVMLGVGAVSLALTGYACVFQGWLARGEGVRPPTTPSTYLWVCYQKFFRFWANRTPLFCYGPTSAKNVKNSPLYPVKCSPEGFEKKQKHPPRKSFKRGRKIH